MHRFWFLVPTIQLVLVVLALVGLGSGCSTTIGNIAAGIGGTAFLAHSPSNEIEQIYYLGVFDPQEQVEPTVYRVRVHGQASAMSGMKFSSGWVLADVIDSLGTSVNFHGDGAVLSIEESEKLSDALPTGRKLVLFGPEGFRPAPENHRLVIVMGSSPEAFFQAIDESLGAVSKVKFDQQNQKLQQDVFKELQQIGKERHSLDELAKDLHELKERE
ncbi:MAG: hypothetical protein GY774_02145 [Planctomycetes bacterium]|nr:hypothetical protein [Planctomycetota bacterium]